MQLAVAVALLVMMSISFTSWLVFRLVRGQSGVIQSRLETYAARGRGDVEEGPRQRRTMAVELDQILRRRGFGRRIAKDLAMADLQLRVSEFVSLCLLAAVFGALLGLVLFNLPVLALLSAVVGYFLPGLSVKRRQSARLKAFNDQLADAMRLLVSSLRSGYSMLQSMDVVASELPEPIGKEFSRAVREVTLGLSQEQALNNMLERVPSDDLDMMVTAVNVQHEVGGNLAEILDTIGDTISERVRITGEIRVLTAQQVLTGYLLSFLPFAVTLVLFAINRPYMMQLFQDPCGLSIAGVALLMIGIGYMIIRKIVSIKV